MITMKRRRKNKKRGREREKKEPPRYQAGEEEAGFVDIVLSYSVWLRRQGMKGGEKEIRIETSVL